MAIGGEYVGVWGTFLANLRSSHDRIKEGVDELVWTFAPTWYYTPRVGYLHLSVEDDRTNSMCWLKVLWKFKFLSKAKNFMCCLLNDKALTQNNLQKKTKQGMVGVLCVNVAKIQMVILLWNALTIVMYGKRLKGWQV